MTANQTAAPVIVQARCGDTRPQRYTLVRRETESVYGSGRPGSGVCVKSEASRRLISDEWVWFEGDDRAAKREAFIAEHVAAYGLRTAALA